MLYFVFNDVRLIDVCNTINYQKVILVILSLLLLKNNRVYKYIRIYIKRSITITITIYCEVVSMHKSKEFLRSIRRAECLIERKREQIERMRDLAVHSGVSYEEGRGSRRIQDSKAEIVARIADTEKEMERQIDELIDMKLEAMRMIDSLSDGDTADVLYMRYFEHRKWSDIAEAKHHSLDWVYKKHREGLKNISEKC